MKETTFKGIKPQLVKLGFNDEILSHEQWDSYNAWNIRDRQVKNGQKSTSLKLKMKQQILDTETNEVLSERDNDKFIQVFHHSQTDPVDKTGILEDVGNFDMENGDKTYEQSSLVANSNSELSDVSEDREDLFKEMAA
jgi:hypothetical protein